MKTFEDCSPRTSILLLLTLLTLPPTLGAQSDVPLGVCGAQALGRGLQPPAQEALEHVRPPPHNVGKHGP